MRSKRLIGIIILIGALIIAFHTLLKPKMEDTPTPFYIEHIDETIEIAEEVSAIFDFGSDAPENFEFIRKGIIYPGDSFLMPMLNLQVTVNSVNLSSNVFGAGWSIDDFYLDEAMVVLENAVTATPINMLADNIDYSSGELSRGLTLVTVDLSVKNMNGDNVCFGPEQNVFGNDVLYLVNARVSEQNDYGGLPAYKSVACSCERPSTGQRAWVRILPGEVQRYKLAYIADDFVSVENGFISSFDRPMEGVCFFPLAFAETIE